MCATSPCDFTSIFLRPCSLATTDSAGRGWTFLRESGGSLENPSAFQCLAVLISPEWLDVTLCACSGVCILGDSEQNSQSAAGVRSRESTPPPTAFTPTTRTRGTYCCPVCSSFLGLILKMAVSPGNVETIVLLTLYVFLKHSFFHGRLHFGSQKGKRNTAAFVSALPVNDSPDTDFPLGRWMDGN